MQVQVKAAGINPGDTSIRAGAYAGRWPASFPSGEGDFAGVVSAVGDGVNAPAVGTEVIGWTDQRASHAEHVVVPADQVVPKPPQLPWEVAGGLYGAGYVDLAVSLGVPVERIVTITDFAAAERTGARMVFGADTSGAAA